METNVPFPGLLTGLSVELQWEILLKLDAVSMLNLCQINKQFANVCANDNLWKVKLKDELGEGVVPLPGKTWRQTYVETHAKNLFLIDVGYEGNFLGKMWFAAEEPPSKVFTDISKLFPELNVNLLAIYKNDGRRRLFARKSSQRALAHMISFNDVIRVEGSSESPLTIVLPDRSEHHIWLHTSKEESATVGDFIDAVRRIDPNAGSITTEGFGRTFSSFVISNNPESRAESLYSFFHRNGVLRTHPISIGH